MVKAYIIGGILAALLALWLIKGILEAGAHRQEAIAHKIEIRRSNPILHRRWRDRKQSAELAGKPFTEPEPIDTSVADLKPGVPYQLEEGLEIVLTEEVKP